MGAEPAVGVLDPRLGRRRGDRVDDGAGTATPVSTVSARVKFTFTSSVVQPTGSSSVVTKAGAIAESMSVIARPAWTIPIGL